MVSWLLLARSHAFRGWLTWPTRLVMGFVDVMLARGKHVGVLGFRRQSMHLEESPGTRGETAVASHSALYKAARQHVFCRQLVLDSAVAGNAQSVAHRFL
eukprot:748733-Hanusia_phi.AAC.1